MYIATHRLLGTILFLSLSTPHADAACYFFRACTADPGFRQNQTCRVNGTVIQGWVTVRIDYAVEIDADHPKPEGTRHSVYPDPDIRCATVIFNYREDNVGTLGRIVRVSNPVDANGVPLVAGGPMDLLGCGGGL